MNHFLSFKAIRSKVQIALLVGCLSLIQGESSETISHKRIEPKEYTFQQIASGFNQNVAAEILSSKFAERLKARINAKQEPPINWSFDYEEYLNGRVTRVGQFDKNSTIRNPFSVPKMELGAIVRLLDGNVSLDEAWEAIGTPSLPDAGMLLVHEWRLWLPELDGAGPAPVIIKTYFAQKDHGRGKRVDPARLRLVAFTVFRGKAVDPEKRRAR